MLNKMAFIGWDVGGAHVKAALLDNDGVVRHVVQLPCTLWRGLSFLEAAVEDILHTFKSTLDQYQHAQCQHTEFQHTRYAITHAVTMTGELVDLFENRQMGVLEISRVMHEKLNSEVVFFQASRDSNNHFVNFSEVKSYWQDIASVNWLASAYLIGQKIQAGVLIDMGSTTTDYIVLHQGKPQCIGFTDALRLQSQELMYTGVIRTPLMALTQRISFKGKESSLAAEYFATTADVYRLLGELPLDEDMAETADGQDKSQRATARRIARMIGYDVEDASMQDWLNLAKNFKSIHLNTLAEVAKIQLERFIKLAPSSKVVTIIGAGAGHFLLKQLALQLNDTFKNNRYLQSIHIEYEHSNNLMCFTSNESSAATWAGICLPAVAVATLAAQNQLK